ncbi:hypothetical protein D6829_00330 [Candidatus Pacearchaeota archaeon]|nr:MAG: hypothetical protein D6829_00330 [Candidatus Pacearchaeota archaeon]
MRAFVFFIIISIGIASAFEISCPNKVFVGEEFKCKINQVEQEPFDLKIEIKKESKNIAKVFDWGKNQWRSSYYYIKNFQDSGKDYVLVMVLEKGEFLAKAKFRIGKKIKVNNFKISVEDKDNNQKEKNKDSRLKKDKTFEPAVISILENKTLEKIDLGGKSPVVVYESKNYRMARYSFWAFILFLIILALIIRKR